jgi:type II secretory pathway pseudopilin PulG
MRRAERIGFTMVELLIGLTLMSIVGGAVAAAVASQWRSHDALADAERSRQALRDGANVLLGELRAISPAAGDLVSALDTALEVRSTLGASVLCSLAVTRDRLMLPPRHPTVGAALTWWRDGPVAGDSVDILDGRGASPDTISRHEVVDLASGRCSLSSGFVRSAGDAWSSLQLTVSPPLPLSIGIGAPLRFLRRARYSLYRSSTDGRWYLRIKELLGGSWNGIQPVAGPFAAPLASGAGGMAITVRDTAGSPIGGPPFGTARAMAIDLRSRGAQPARALGRAVVVSESLHVTLAPRNE